MSPPNSGDLLKEKVQRLVEGQIAADEITNKQEVIDSRDIIAGIEYMESLKGEEAEEYSEQLKRFKDLAEEGESSATDWEHGEALIHTDYFTDYSMQFAKDTGGLPNDIPRWIVIDEDATAENLKQDYGNIDFDGETYYIR